MNLIWQKPMMVTFQRSPFFAFRSWRHGGQSVRQFMTRPLHDMTGFAPLAERKGGSRHLLVQLESRSRWSGLCNCCRHHHHFSYDIDFHIQLKTLPSFEHLRKSDIQPYGEGIGGVFFSRLCVTIFIAGCLIEFSIQSTRPRVSSAESPVGHYFPPTR